MHLAVQCTTAACMFARGDSVVVSAGIFMAATAGHFTQCCHLPDERRVIAYNMSRDCLS